jgi:hypothetical protein
MYYSCLRFCHFYVAQNMKYLELIFCMFVGHIISNIRIFSEFWKTQKYEFFSRKMRAHVPMCIKSLFLFSFKNNHLFRPI